MARNIDLMISAKDNYTDALRKMQSAQTAFRKDMGQLNQELTKLNNNKVTLKVDMTKASNELKQAKKDFSNLSDEMSRNKLIAAQTKYDTIKRNLDLVSSAARQTEKDMKNLTSQISKTDNRAATFGSGTPTQKNTLTLKGLGQAGLYNLVGQSLATAGQTYITSAFGSETGNAIGSIAGGITSGAAIGSMILPGVGTAIGAVVGAAAGSITAAAENYATKDETFKGVVKSEYDRVKGIEENTLTKGSELAAGREMTRISFETQLGSPEAAQGILSQVHSYAAKTPYEYDTVANTAKQLVTFGTETDDAMNRVGQLGDMAQGKSDILERITLAYGKMTAKQKVSLEELNMMTEAGIPILKQLTRQYGVTEEEMFKMISSGKLGIDDINTAMDNLTGEGGAFYNMSEKMSTTYSGLKSTMDSLDSDIQSAMGEGYNNTRMEGMKAQIDWMSGENGDKMKEAYNAMGAWQADLENQREELLRTHINNVMSGEEYQEAIENGDGATAGRLIAEARVAAENEYRQSEGYQLMQQTDMTLVGSLQETLAPSWFNYGYTMQKEFEKGRASVPAAPTTPTGTATTRAPSDISNMVYVGGRAYSYAVGATYIPYDNFPALLHEGERVLTAREARNYKDGGGVNINISGTTVREEADITRIANEIVRKIQQAKAVYVG